MKMFLSLIALVLVPVQEPDVTGVWYTRHAFDLSDAVPAELKDAFTPLRGLDQAIVQQLHLTSRQQALAAIVAAEAKKHSRHPSNPSSESAMTSERFSARSETRARCGS